MVSGLKIIQISSNPEDQREIESESSLRSLGYRYIRIINPRFQDLPPKGNVYGGHDEWIVGKTKEDPNQWGLTSGHYGAWLGHSMALLSSLSDDDYTLICECDCLISVDPEKFKRRVDEAIEVMETTDYKMVRFEHARKDIVPFYNRVSENLYECPTMTLAHCYLVHRKHQKFYMNCLKNTGWHTPDWWWSLCFKERGEMMVAFPDLKLTKQSAGTSLLDGIYQEEREV